MPQADAKCWIYLPPGTTSTPAPVRSVLGDPKRLSERPEQADYLVTGGSLTPELERRAALLGALPVCLPAAADWLLAKVRSRTRTVLVWSAR